MVAMAPYHLIRPCSSYTLDSQSERHRSNWTQYNSAVGHWSCRGYLQGVIRQHESIILLSKNWHKMLWLMPSTLLYVIEMEPICFALLFGFSLSWKKSDWVVIGHTRWVMCPCCLRLRRWQSRCPGAALLSYCGRVFCCEHQAASWRNGSKGRPLLEAA